MNLKKLMDDVVDCIQTRHFPSTIGLYLRGKFDLRNSQAMDVIELEITSVCNLGCANCDRSCSKDQAPTNETMTVEQVKKFIAQCIQTRKRWYKIKVLGGEPTVHPEWITILNLLKAYRDEYNPHAKLELVTNGYGPVVNERLKLVPPGVLINNSSKTSRIQPTFCTYAVAPCDVPDYANADYLKGCGIPQLCGMALTRYGYYLCGAGASVDRVFGLGLGIRELSEVTPGKFFQSRKILCRYCGHFKSSNTDLSISPTWQKAYADYAKQRPVLPLF